MNWKGDEIKGHLTILNCEKHAVELERVGEGVYGIVFTQAETEERKTALPGKESTQENMLQTCKVRKRKSYEGNITRCCP